MSQNNYFTNAIPKNILIDKTLFQVDRCKFNRLIPVISFILYIDPQKLSDTKDANLKHDLYDAIHLILKKIHNQKILIISPKIPKFKKLQQYFNAVSSNTVWLELIKEAHFFKLNHFQKKNNIVKNKLNDGIHLIKINQKNLNQKFLAKPNSQLLQFIPELKKMDPLIKLINVEDLFPNEQLCLSLNAALNKAICYLTEKPFARLNIEYPSNRNISDFLCNADPNWRKFMAFEISRQMDFKMFGVNAVFLIGSAKNNNAGIGSDIDLMIHFTGSELQKKELDLWLEGWGRCLSVINYLKTGYKINGILDVHYISDASIKDKDSFAIKIGAVTDAALLLKSVND